MSISIVQAVEFYGRTEWENGVRACIEDITKKRDKAKAKRDSFAEDTSFWKRWNDDVVLYDELIEEFDDSLVLRIEDDD